jgi:hypothetical protein
MMREVDDLCMKFLPLRYFYAFTTFALFCIIENGYGLLSGTYLPI